MPIVHLSDATMIVADVVAWGVIQGGAGYLAHRLPDRCFDHDTWWTRPRRIERDGRLYDAFRIKRWKDRLPEAGDMFAGGLSKRSLPGTSRIALERFATATRRAEWTHRLPALVSPVFALWNRPWISAVMIAYGIGLNAPFIAIQRYNRLRVSRALTRRPDGSAARAESRSERPSLASARERNARDTTGNSIP
jgi:glycosyl-4,4'-diaponeurosporenoate acyltransferase